VTTHVKYFSQFRFDESDRKLWAGSELVPLTRKAADVLACLVSHAGATVTHQMLLQFVWPDTHVQPDNVKVLVHEVRHALGDNSTTPRFIGSESGRGYAFIAAVAEAPCPLLEAAGYDHRSLVSRDALLDVMEGALQHAMQDGELSCVFLEGIPGSGKTSACRELFRRAQKWPALRSAYGRAYRASGGPFPAIVALLERLSARYPQRVRPVLSRRAPTWISLLDGATPANGLDQLEATPERLAFELIDALGDLGQEDGYLLVLDDLHFSPGGLDILSFLATESMRSRIAIVATYSPFGVPAAQRPGGAPAWRATAHPAPLQFLPLSDADVEQYLERRFGGLCAGILARPVSDATMGHPGSVTRVADALASTGILRQGVSGWNLRKPLKLVHQVIADTLIDTIRTQLDRLGHEERRVLEAAAGVGWKFTDRAVAAALGEPGEDALRHDLDLLALHLPVFERLSPPRGSQAGRGATFRFRHRQWFDLLRGQTSNMATV
jgi:DNA-binding winged helix-turn-helix (wHTH) protein